MSSRSSAFRRAVAISIVLALVAIAASVGAQQKPPEPRSDQAAAATDAPVYKPPVRGAPGGRVGGGTRGVGREPAFVLSVLAPNHTGLTTSEEPALFWFISSASSYPVEVTLVDPQKTDPLLELRIDPPVAAGVHRLRLADHKIKLAPGAAYQWYVAVVPDTGRRSKDILAGGMIERVATPDGLAAQVTRTGKRDLPALYANAGLWYDALAALGDLIEASPQDRALLDQRSQLLRQIGLPDTGQAATTP